MNPQIRNQMPLPDETYLGRIPGAGPSSDPYAAAASRTAVPITNSPPLSHNSTDNSLSSRPHSGRSPTASASHISSSSSVARSSDGAGFFSPATSEFRKSVKSSKSEEALHEHYAVLKTYLAPYLRDEAGNKRPTKARDKLLRLSPTQFNELSTDVYDELRRREDDRRRPGGVVPPSLPPKNSFHPKRNQARQKLSTLPLERFRQLSTDVFYELERRMPRLGDGDRPASPTGSVASSVRSSTRHMPPNGMRQPSGPPNGMRGPPPPGLRPVGPPGPTSYQPYSPSSPVMPPRTDSRGGPSGNFGRPLPQTFQSNTMVPNKSTMVEDDETDEDEDEAYGLNSPSGKDAETIKAFESQVAELQSKIAELEGKVRDKDAEVDTAKENHNREREEWTQARGDLDMKIAESQQTLETIHNELEQAHEDRNQSETSLRAHTEQAVSDLHNELEELRRDNDALRAQVTASQESDRDGDWQQRCEKLQQELAEQRKVTSKVRHNAEQFLQEMRLLSEQSELALEQEEQLRSQIASLEAESEEWKSRYAKSRTQLRTLKATSMGLPSQHMAPGVFSVRQEYLKPTGQVNDMDVTNFQISIDELLQAAREAPSSPESALEKVKDVVQSVRSMTAGVDGSFTNVNSPYSSTSGQIPQNGVGSTPSKLKARVSRDANNLVTVTRNHAAANGLSPVSLVDAAASNLTTSVIEFVKVLGIRPSVEDGGEDDLSLADGEEIEEIVAPLSTNKSVIVKAPVPPQKQTAGAGWFSMLKGGATSDHSEDEDDYDDYS